MTAAHELAHVLFDLPHHGMVLSAERESSPLYRWFEAIEQRANAFAAYLLVPPEGVRAVEAGRGANLDVATELALRYGVGIETATQTLCNVLGSSMIERSRLLDAPPQLRSRVDHPDANVPSSPVEQLREGVARAYNRGKIGPVEARTTLGIRMGDLLPDGFIDRTPVLTLPQRLRNAALRQARDAGWSDAVPGDILLTDGGYDIALQSAMAGAPSRLHITDGSLDSDEP